MIEIHTKEKTVTVKKIVKDETELPKKCIFIKRVQPKCERIYYLIYETFTGHWYALQKRTKPCHYSQMKLF